MTIQEEYVSEDTAILLKETDFNEYTNFYFVYHPYQPPTQQLTLRWLREIHNLHIYAFHVNTSDDTPQWVYEIEKLDEDWTYSKHHGNTYEECIEEAIKYACQNYVQRM